MAGGPLGRIASWNVLWGNTLSELLNIILDVGGVGIGLSDIGAVSLTGGNIGSIVVTGLPIMALQGCVVGGAALGGIKLPCDVRLWALTVSARCHLGKI